MAADTTGETWDLSDNDTAAIAAVLNNHQQLIDALKGYMGGACDCPATISSAPRYTQDGACDLCKRAAAALAAAEGSK